MDNKGINELLKTHGLIAGAIAVEECSLSIQTQLHATGIEHPQHGSLAVIANAGPGFWGALEKSPLLHNAENPIDALSLNVALQLIDMMQLRASQTHHKILYPSTHNIPLMQLGNLLGWTHASSPLGLGLHHEYGPWFAYRCVFYFEGAIPAIFQVGKTNDMTSPCLSCKDTPCVSACPTQAVSSIADFDIKRCSDYQQLENTTCAQSCHARNACPVGATYRYSLAQQAHHTEFAIAGLKRWLDTQTELGSGLKDN